MEIIFFSPFFSHQQKKVVRVKYEKKNFSIPQNNIMCPFDRYFFRNNNKKTHTNLFVSCDLVYSQCVLFALSPVTLFGLFFVVQTVCRLQIQLMNGTMRPKNLTNFFIPPKRRIKYTRNTEKKSIQLCVCTHNTEHAFGMRFI